MLSAEVYVQRARINIRGRLTNKNLLNSKQKQNTSKQNSVTGLSHRVMGCLKQR
jgi:hypothetical protein